MTRRCKWAAFALALLVSIPTLAKSFEITWSTVDTGGVVVSTGGDFELSGTIAQPDADGASGPHGDYTLHAGFWTVSDPACVCLSDVNGDGYRDGADIQDFVDCLILGGADCACADMDESESVTIADIALFVDDLLAGGGACP